MNEQQKARLARLQRSADKLYKQAYAFDKQLGTVGSSTILGPIEDTCNAIAALLNQPE